MSISIDKKEKEKIKKLEEQGVPSKDEIEEENSRLLKKEKEFQKNFLKQP